MSHNLKPKTLEKLLTEGRSLGSNVDRVAYHLMGVGKFDPKMFSEARIIVTEYLRSSASIYYTSEESYTLRRKPITDYTYEYRKGKFVDIKNLVAIEFFKYYDEGEMAIKVLTKLLFSDGDYLIYHSGENPVSITNFLATKRMRITKGEGSMMTSQDSNRRRRELLGITKKEAIKIGWKRLTVEHY
jgi:hypothetical protein